VRHLVRTAASFWHGSVKPDTVCPLRACARCTRILRINRGIVGATKLGYGVLATVCQELLLRIDRQDGIDEVVSSAAGRQLVRHYRAAKALVLREGLLKFMIAKDAVN
jgi:hypothetical protein